MCKLANMACMLAIVLWTLLAVGYSKESDLIESSELEEKKLPQRLAKNTVLGTLILAARSRFLCNVAIISHKHAVTVLSCHQDWDKRAMRVISDAYFSRGVLKVDDIEDDGEISVLLFASNKDMGPEHAVQFLDSEEIKPETKFTSLVLTRNPKIKNKTQGKLVTINGSNKCEIFVNQRPEGEEIGDLLFVGRQLTGILTKKGETVGEKVYAVFESFFCHKDFINKFSCVDGTISEPETELKTMYEVKTEDSPEPMSPSETRDSPERMSISETPNSSEPISPSEREKSSQDKSVTKSKITSEKKMKKEKTSSEFKKQPKANNKRVIIVISQPNVE